MALKLKEVGFDHHGDELPDGTFGLTTETDEFVGYKVRWRESDENGVRGQRSKSFNARKLGSLDRAREVALSFGSEVQEIIEGDGTVQKVDAAAALTIDEVFKEWVVKHLSTLSEGYSEKTTRLWKREIGNRPISRVRLDRLSQDQAIITRFQDSLVTEGLSTSSRVEILKLLRAVLRWGRKRHPNGLTIDVTGLFRIPRQKRKRLPYAADAYGLERIIEAVRKRPAQDDLLPLRDAALVGAMGFTVAARPSEWLHSASWDDVHSGAVELQRPHEDEDSPTGLKTGARAALLLPNGYDRLLGYRDALEDRWGPQPGHALVFQVLREDGPVWIEPEGGADPVPLAWSKNEYDRWAARVWRPATKVAALAPGAPKGLATMTFYACRHTAISMALHSTLVMTAHGMNLHNLAAWAGHDVQTLQKHYAHIIARYAGTEPIDLEQECRQARATVEAEPFKLDEKMKSPQHESRRRNRARRRVDAAQP
jgi:integrase